MFTSPPHHHDSFRPTPRGVAPLRSFTGTSPIRNSLARYTVIIRGTVQGVSYRKSAKRIAEELRVRGWVRNLPSGSVKLCLEGEESAIQALLAWCATGPERARVTGLIVEPGHYLNEFDEFEIRHEGGNR